MLSLVSPRDGWHPPVVRTAATLNRGIDELAAAIDKFREHFESTGQRQRKHIEHWQARLVRMLEARLVEQVLPGKAGEARLRAAAEAVASRRLDPFSAVSELLGAM